MEEKHFETAHKMLEYLNPLNTEVWPVGHYIFRGQADSDFPLEPSIRRLSGDVIAAKRWRTKDVTCAQQVKFEQEVLSTFFYACDQSGIIIPGDSSLVREAAQDMTCPDLPSLWPPKELHPVLAFAQHHGVSTCLLDWSRRAYVACYFAASSSLANRSESKSGKLAIWCLNYRARPAWESVAVVEAPGGTSPNLSAQSGLFTASQILGSPEDGFDSSGLQLLPELKQMTEYGAGLIRLTLNLDQAPELLKSCELLGVSGATLFPGYEGIARKVNDWARAELEGFDHDEFAYRDLF